MTNSTRTNGQADKSPRWHAMLGFLIVLNILNMVDRNLLTAFGPQITTDLDLSDTQFGLLTGLVFVTFYSLMGLFMGTLADRVNRPRLMAAGIALWSVMTAYTGAAVSFLQVSLARMSIGVGESTLTPAAMSMLSDIYPPERRGMASGLYYLGVPLGAGASFLIASELGAQIGWRNCFYLLGGIGVLLAIILLFVKDPARGQFDDLSKQPAAGSNFREAIPSMLATLRSTPALFYTMLGAVLFHIPIGSGQFAIIWLVRERNFDETEITATYGLLFIIFGTIGSILGGTVSDWYHRKFAGGRPRFLALAMLLITPFVVFYRWVPPDSIFFYTGMCAGFLVFVIFYGPAFSTVQDLSPPKQRGVMTAFLLLSCNLLGLGVGAMITGVMSDVLASNGVEQPLTWSLIAADILSMLAIPSFLMASRHYQKMQT